MSLWSWMRGWLGGSESASRESGDQSLIALVLFLAEPRDLELAEIAARCGKALGQRFSTGDSERSDYFVAGEEPSFILKAQEDYFLINSFSQPYMEDPEKAAAAIGELRLRKAIREHQAWLSVDLLGEVRKSRLTETYRTIGKLAAAFAGDDCLAVFAPATGQLNLFDDDSVRLLRSENPMELFTVCNHPPVVPASGDDPRLKAAVAKARNRWPEFVTAFEQRHSGQSFAVKARVGDGEVYEFMWIAVTGLENGWIYGRLDNDPIELTHIRCGDRLRVQVKDLNDWLFTDGDQVVGGFTIEVLRKIQDEL